MLFVLALSTLNAGCQQAIGDPCEHDGDCERGLACIMGRCDVPEEENPISSLSIGEQVVLDELEAPVDIVLDSWDTPHIYAHSAHDAWVALGFIMGRQRGVQLEVARRMAQGSLSTLEGSDDELNLNLDMAAQLLEIRRTAEESWALAPIDAPDSIALTAFSLGLSAQRRRVIDGHEPVSERSRELLEDASVEWSPIDSLSISQLEALRRSFDAMSELELHLLLEHANTAFSQNTSNPDYARREGFSDDLFRPSPIVRTSPIARPVELLGNDDRTTPAERPTLPPSLSKGWSDALRSLTALSGPRPASDVAWLGRGSISSTGGGTLGVNLSQPQTAPFRYYTAHIAVRGENGWEAAGICHTGVPAFSTGFTSSLAWAEVTPNVDVTDIFLETLETDENGERAVRLGDQLVEVEPLQIVLESRASPITLETARVPHHGPFLPTLEDGTWSAGWTNTLGLTIAWAGSEASRLLGPHHEIIHAQSVERASSTLHSFERATSTWLVTDSRGARAFFAPNALPQRTRRCLSDAPIRANQCLPYFVMPGTGEAEWEGRIDVPVVELDPLSDLLPFAGGDFAGVTEDNRPASPYSTYLGWAYEPGLRTSALTDTLQAATRRQRAPLADLQATLTVGGDDLTRLLLPALENALERAVAQSETPGSAPDLSRLVNDLGERLEVISQDVASLRAWVDNDESRDAPVEVYRSSETIAGVWHSKLFQAVLGDELELLDARISESLATRAIVNLLTGTEVLRTMDGSTGESTIFDDISTTSRYESRDERLLRSFSDTVDWLESNLGAERSTWRWATVNRAHLLGPLLTMDNEWGVLGGDEGIPLNASIWSPWLCAPQITKNEIGCSETLAGARLAVELRPWGPEAAVVLAGGQVGDPDSERYGREIDLWAGGEFRQLPYSIDNVVADAATRIRLVPEEAAAE